MMKKKKLLPLLLLLLLPVCRCAPPPSRPRASPSSPPTGAGEEREGAPLLQPPGPQHVIPVGPKSEFVLRCSGKSPLEWSLPDDASYPSGVVPLSDRTSVKDEVSDDSPRPLYISHLAVSPLHHLDTGAYTCRYVGTKNDSDPLRAASTHLFASDPKHLFDEVSLYQWVNVPESHEVVIPCRPTDPDRVTMRFLREGMQDITDRLADFHYRYEPRRGLVIEEVTAQFHTGMIVCVAKRGNREMRLTTMFNFQKIDVVPAPNLITPEAGAKTYAGSNLTLGCELGVEPSFPHIELEWILPENLSDANGRVVVGKQNRVRTEQDSLDARLGYQAKITKELRIGGVWQSDEGSYSCRAVIPGSGKVGQARKYQLSNVLQDPTAVYIGEPRFNGDENGVIVMTHGQEAKWVFTLKANPDPKFTWYHPLGHEVDHDTFDKYEKTINPTTGEIKLTINDPGLEDTGKYVLSVEVSDPSHEEEEETGEAEAAETRTEVATHKDIPLVLEFLQEPSLSMDILPSTEEEEETEEGEGGGGKFFFFGSEYQVNCTVEGYPYENGSLRIHFHPCDSYDSCGEPEEVELELVRPDDDYAGRVHYRYMARAKVAASRSGYFACRACTADHLVQKVKGECNETREDFFLVEPEFGPDGFRVIGPMTTWEGKTTEEENALCRECHQDMLAPPVDSAVLVERDNVTLTCGASVYDYGGVDWFVRPAEVGGDSEEEEEEVELVRVGGERVAQERRAFSHAATIDFGEIRLEDQGKYVCKARPIGKEGEGDDNGDDDDNEEEDEEEAPREKSFSLEVQQIISPRRESGNNMNDSEVTLTTGTRLVLNCLVSGRPEPEVTWRKDDKVIPEDVIENRTSLSYQSGDRVLTFEYVLLNDTGVYSCEASNRGGVFRGTFGLTVEPEDTVPKGMIAGIVSLVVVLFGLGAYLLWKVRIYNRKYKELTKAELELFVAGDPSAINPDLGVDDQAELLPYNREFEFPRERLKMGKQLGSGAFGRVVKADAQGIVSWEPNTTVAVKMVKPHADITYIKALMAELKIMIHLGRHLNILNLLGACTTSLNKRELLVIVEYCRFGNIQKYLLLHRNSYINQINPATADIDFKIGADIIEQHGNDLPRAREEDEMSAAYAGGNRNLSLTTTTDGGTMTNGNGLLRPPRQTSVRYIADPSEHVSGRQVRGTGGGGRRRPRRLGEQPQTDGSDYNDGLDQIIMTTDMTTVPAETSATSEEESSPRKQAKRSMSNVSSQGPGWRANFRGDYEEQTVRPICTKDLICWAYQVARGMDYLASKKVMHGDLACRNILLAADNVVKICDFGLAKDIYKTNNYRKKTDGPLPIKWMAIESLRDHIFSTQSDVWSFGIVLWEMFSLGKNPYPGVSPGDVYYMLQNGSRMEKPDYCPRVVYRTMLDCWNSDPSQRPNFGELMSGLGELLEDSEKDNYLTLSERFAQQHSAATGPNAVENRNYLDMMCSPDFNQQMSVTCDAGAPTGGGGGGGGGSEEEGYLIPTRKNTASSSGSFVGGGGAGEMLPTSEEGYLLPQEVARQQQQQQQKRQVLRQVQESVDESGYLMPNEIVASASASAAAAPGDGAKNGAANGGTRNGKRVLSSTTSSTSSSSGAATTLATAGTVEAAATAEEEEESTPMLRDRDDANVIVGAGGGGETVA